MSTWTGGGITLPSSLYLVGPSCISFLGFIEGGPAPSGVMSVPFGGLYCVVILTPVSKFVRS